jgi:hypothetical protein
MPGTTRGRFLGFMYVATADHHRLARAFLALTDDLAPEPVRRSVRLALIAVAAALVLAVAVPLAWMAPASRSLSAKVGDQPAATLGNSKAVLAAADDEDDDGGQ